MQLPKGITGFWEQADPPRTDERAFRAVCHAVALTGQGQVESFDSVSGQVARNFSVATLSFSSSRVAVLLHAHFPWIAFAEPLLDHSSTISFIDWPAGVEQFRSCSEYTILTRQRLLEPVSKQDTSKLAAAELKEMKYWRPATLGEVVFNFWD